MKKKVYSTKPYSVSKEKCTGFLIRAKNVFMKDVEGYVTKRKEQWYGKYYTHIDLDGVNSDSITFNEDPVRLLVNSHVIKTFSQALGNLALVRKLHPEAKVKLYSVNPLSRHSFTLSKLKGY